MAETERQRRDYGSGSISQMKNGTWTARMVIGVNEKGKPRIKALYGKTEREVKKKLKDFQKEFYKNDQTVVQRSTVEGYMRTWLYENKQNELKPKSFDRLEQTVLYQVIPKVGHIQLAAFQSNDVQTMLNTLKKEGLSYRKVIKPFDARMVEAVRKRGVVFERHCCGKCEEVIPDFVEMGVQIWQSAQPMNDIAGILDKYKGKLAIEGGWDSSGPASYSNSTDEDVRAEIRRCLTEYKKPGMMLWPLLYNEQGNAMMVGDRRLPALMDEWNKHRFF